MLFLVLLLILALFRQFIVAFPVRVLVHQARRSVMLLMLMLIIVAAFLLLEHAAMDDQGCFTPTVSTVLLLCDSVTENRQLMARPTVLI